MCLMLGAFGLVTTLSTGCQETHRKGVLVESPTRALLAAARSGQINMFGDFSTGGQASYFTRSSVSLRRHTFSEVGSDFDPDIDLAGKRVVYTSTCHNARPDLYIKLVDGVAKTQLTSDPSADVQPAINGEDTRVAFASDRTGNWDLWVVGLDGSAPVQITSGESDDIHPSWSPDGTRLVYCSLPAQGGQWELWVTDAFSGGNNRFIGYGLFPEWSPTGNTIVYQRARERGSKAFGIWTITLIDGEPRYPTELISAANEAMTLPTWNPDGNRIAFARAAAVNEITEFSRVHPSDIWIMDADGQGAMRLTDGFSSNYSPVFSTSGRIFFTSNRSGNENIWSVLPASSYRAESLDTVSGPSSISDGISVADGT